MTSSHPMSSRRPPLFVSESSGLGITSQQLSVHYLRNHDRFIRGNLDGVSQQQRASTANSVTTYQLDVGVTAERQPPPYSVHRNTFDPTANSVTPYQLDVEVSAEQQPPPYSVHRNIADPTANSVTSYPFDIEVIESQLPAYSVRRKRADPPSYDEVWNEDEQQISIIRRNTTRPTLQSYVPRNTVIPSNNGVVIGGTTLARPDVGEAAALTPSNTPSRQTPNGDQELSPSENRPYVIFALCSVLVCCISPFCIVLNIGVITSAFSASDSTDKRKKRRSIMVCILLTFLSFASSLTVYLILLRRRRIG